MFLFRGIIKYLTSKAPVTGSASLSLFYDTVPIKLGCMLLVVAIGFFFFRFTKFGTYLKAIGAGEKAAKYAGIRTDRMKFLIYILSGAITGFAAFVSVLHTGSVTSSGGNQLETQILIALVLGGMPISGGAKVRFENIIVGSLLYTVLQSGLTMIGYTTQTMQLLKIITIQHPRLGTLRVPRCGQTERLRRLSSLEKLLKPFCEQALRPDFISFPRDAE